MAPDLNSLPPSRSPSTSRILSTANGSPHASASPPSPSSHSPHSLAATAALNAGARSTERRRSSARMHLNLNDPASVAGIAEAGINPLRSSPSRMADRERAPSLGELHQELESEQEGQVNRLLNMIRQQHVQIQALTLSRTASNTSASTQAQAIDDSTPTSERSMSLSHSQPPTASIPPSAPSSVPRSRSPFHGPHRVELSRQSSYRSSRNTSPLIRPISRHDTASPEFTLGQPATQRDDAAFYMAETQSLGRENAMLRMRIRELERQLAEANQGSSSLATTSANEATTTSGTTSAATEEQKDENVT